MEHDHSHDETIWQQLAENLEFILAALAIIAVIAVLAKIAEDVVLKKIGKQELKKWSAKKIACTGLFAALGGVLMTIEIPLVFIAPDFYKLDVSDVAGMMAGFLLGPVSAVCVEFIKAVLHIVLHGTHSAFVGELASFVCGCFFVLPTSYLYLLKRTRKRAIFSTVIGSLSLVVFASLFNGFYLIPKFAELYGVPMDAIIAMGSAMRRGITSLWSFVALATAPFNFFKAAVDAVIVILIYKPISNLYHKI